MDIRTSEGAGHLAVRATGDLTVRTVPDLRDALLKAAAEQPLGLLCDLRQVRATRESLTILHVVADQVADWPASPLAVVAHDRCCSTSWIGWGCGAGCRSRPTTTRPSRRCGTPRASCGSRPGWTPARTRPREPGASPASTCADGRWGRPSARRCG